MGNMLMIITAALWGFSFVVQKTGMVFMGPFIFSGIRFVLGASCLCLVLRWFGGQSLNKQGVYSGVCMGVVLTFGVMLQQIGIVDTTAGKASFLTMIYILLVPVFLSLAGKRLALRIWPAACLVLFGLYFLSIQAGDLNSINPGDYWVLSSSVFWAIHILLVEKSVRQHDPLRLSIIQFYTCALLCLVGAFLFENISWAGVLAGIQGGYQELLFGSVASVAIAYTLHVYALRSVPSQHAALILSLEAVFGVLGGVWFLDEVLTVRMISGFLLMFSGIILAQWSQRQV